MRELPLPLRVPTVLFPLAMPSTAQVAPVVVVPVTEAVKVAEVPAVTVAVPGLRVMATTGWTACTVMVAEAFFVASAWLVAVREWMPPAEGAV